MKIMVVSDSHGAESLFFKAVECELEDLSHLFFLGDGADDFIRIRDSFPGINVAAVKGNCDFFSQFNTMDIMTVFGKQFFYTHGHIYGVKEGIDRLVSASMGACADAVLYGHPHCPLVETRNGFLIMNPGAMKFGSYGIITLENGELKGKIKCI